MVTSQTAIGAMLGDIREYMRATSDVLYHRTTPAIWGNTSVVRSGW